MPLREGAVTPASLESSRSLHASADVDNRHARRRVVDYYDQLWNDYRIVWRSDRTGAIHFGYFDEAEGSTRNWRDALLFWVGMPVNLAIAMASMPIWLVGLRETAVRMARLAVRGRATRHEAAQEAMTREVWRASGIAGGERVLDAGCGVGGTDVWLARAGASVVGINVQLRQLLEAQAAARRGGVCVRLSCQDYTQMAFADSVFDVVWGLESICHCQNKAAFLREAWRVLKPGGRLVVADFFQLKSLLSATEARDMTLWTSGWAIPHLATTCGFRRDLLHLGFEQIIYRDVRANVMPSARRLLTASRVAYPIGRVAELLRLRTPTQTANIRAAHLQYRTLKDEVWTYGIFTARKPRP
jgi:tocopherol O-methyltransferase